MPQHEMSSYVTSQPILKSAPQMMREAEKRGGTRRRQPVGDRRALGSRDAGRGALDDHRDDGPRRIPDPDRPHAHAHRPQGPQRDLTDDEIERAIAEIQSTIQKYRKSKASLDVGAKLAVNAAALAYFRVAIASPNRMRQLIIDTETTGLDPQPGPPDHRDRGHRARRPPAHRPPPALQAQSGARDRRRRDRGARHDLGRSAATSRRSATSPPSSSTSRAAPSG